MSNNPPTALARRLYGQMSLIRTLEEKLLELFARDEIAGTTHTYIGQEAIAVAVMGHITEQDVVFSSHRCHGHYLAYGGPTVDLVAEIMGREGGLCGGRGGSQNVTFRGFHSSGVQGGVVANCTGAALANKLKGGNGIGVVFLGDGTLGEGLLYESLNFASLWAIPVLYVLENNRFAQSTPVELGVAGSILDRARAFGIAADEVETNDAMILHSLFEERICQVRDVRRPFLQVVNTYRLGPHSKGDDHRSAEELQLWQRNDPLLVIRHYLDEQTRGVLEKEAQQQVEAAVEEARAMPFPSRQHLEFDSSEVLSPPVVERIPSPEAIDQTVLQSLNHALHRLLGHHSEVVVIGEDLLDPYGGAFKVTLGLSTAFPDRVLTTPISEAGIVGLSVGMAMQGLRPIAEIMFGDFLTLCADQLINHASKYQWMYNNQVTIPLVVRTPMGGRRGYGPTHSQSLEKLFMGVPGLAVVAPSHLHDPGELLIEAVLNVDSPVLFVEHKLLYSLSVLRPTDGRVGNFFVRSSERRFPTLHLSLTDFDQPDAAIITYGGNLPLAMEAAELLLMDHEISVDIVVPSLIAPLPLSEIVEMLGNSPLVATLEEGTRRQGWGAEIIASLEDPPYRIPRNYVRIAAPDCPIPNSRPLEVELLPNLDAVVRAILEATV